MSDLVIGGVILLSSFLVAFFVISIEFKGFAFSNYIQHLKDKKKAKVNGAVLSEVWNFDGKKVDTNEYEEMKEVLAKLKEVTQSNTISIEHLLNKTEDIASKTKEINELTTFFKLGGGLTRSEIGTDVKDYRTRSIKNSMNRYTLKISHGQYIEMSLHLN